MRAIVTASVRVEPVFTAYATETKEEEAVQNAILSPYLAGWLERMEPFFSGQIPGAEFTHPGLGIENGLPFLESHLEFPSHFNSEVQAAIEAMDRAEDESPAALEADQAAEEKLTAHLQTEAVRFGFYVQITVTELGFQYCN